MQNSFNNNYCGQESEEFSYIFGRNTIALIFLESKFK